MSSINRISAVIVTHNSEKFIGRAITSLRQSTVPFQQIIIVDSASKDTKVLKTLPITLIEEKENIGFCKGNNLGFKRVEEAVDYVLFLNPDAFIEADFIEKALSCFEKNPSLGVVSCPLYGFDFEKGAPSGLLDSLGIYSTWYGRWYDLGQGKKRGPVENASPEALCGALLFCRKEALKKAILPSGDLFDNRFFMYKDDIDLSLRIKKAGYSLLLLNDAKAYHGRGWNKQRSHQPRSLRLLSARNELKVSLRHGFYHHLPYNLLKLLAVSVFDI